jgi:hypothetical protein
MFLIKKRDLLFYIEELRITDGKGVTSRMSRQGCGVVTGQLDALQRLCAEQKEYNLFDPHVFDAFLLARNDIFAVYKEKSRQQQKNIGII